MAGDTEGNLRELALGDGFVSPAIDMALTLKCLTFVTVPFLSRM
jgi:hypothetical protein